MMAIDNPWDGLVPGAVDARRVDRSGRWDFFWWVSEKAEAGLILGLTPGTEEIRPLPKLRSLDLRYQDIPSGRALVVVLRDQEQIELFATLGRDIVTAGESAGTLDDALARSVRRTIRWHHLLRGGVSSRLSLEEQRGLVGELHFLSFLCDRVGERAAIESWKGPEGSAKDFELGSCLVEVKARRGAAKPFVHISSEDQLSDVPGFPLFLRVCDVDAVVKPEGLTLTDHAREMEERFQKADLIAYALWETAIEATGFAFEDDYSDRRWTVGRTQDFAVRNGFPRIAPPLVTGVGSVRYSIAIETCQPFLTDAATIDALISGS